MRRLAVLPVLGLLLVGGCASPGDPPPVQSTSVPIPTATTEAPVPAVVTDLVITVDGFRATDADDEIVEQFDWSPSSAPLAIDYITSLLGSAPATSPYSGGFHDVDGTYYQWEGVLLTHSHGVDGQEDRGFRLRFEGASVGALMLRTTSGVTLGSTIADVEAAGGHPISLSGASVLYGVDEVTVPAEGDLGPEVLSVGAYTSGSGVIEWIQAPYSNHAP